MSNGDYKLWLEMSLALMTERVNLAVKAFQEGKPREVAHNLVKMELFLADLNE